LDVKILTGNKRPSRKVIFEADLPIVATREQINYALGLIASTKWSE